MKSSVCLFFKVHQPFSLKSYTADQVGVNHSYADELTDEIMINSLADECYLPANTIMIDSIRKTGGAFKVNYSISGTTLELMAKYRPDLIDSFRELINTGSVEIMGETYYHSLSFLHSKREFHRQICKHAMLIYELFGQTPTIFRNTELIYNNQLAKYISALGYTGILCEGSQKILAGRSPNKLYKAKEAEEMTLFLRNPALSDDIAFRFDDHNWNEFPLTAEKFAAWLQLHPAGTEIINLFLDYETFGVHKKAGSGIFEFLKALPGAVLNEGNLAFSNAAEALEKDVPKDVYDVPNTISWEDHSAACCFWSENARQNNTLKKIYSLENSILRSNDDKLRETWGRLQSADYIYHMADSNSQREKHIDPFNTPQEVYTYYTNIVTDMEIALITEQLLKHNMHYINQTYNVF